MHIKKTFRTVLIFSLVFAIVLLFSLSGCMESSDTPAPTQETAEPEQEASTAVSCKLITRIAESDGAESGFSNVYTYGNDGYEKNYIFCAVDIEDVTIWSLSYDTENDILYRADSSGHTVGTLKTGEAVLLDIDVPEGIPNLSISYNYAGTYYEYALGYNGRDGGLSFVECDIADCSPEKTEQVQIDNESFVITVYYIDGNGEHLASQQRTAKSVSAWHVWEQLKLANNAVPIKTGLNSFTVRDDNIAFIDLTSEIYSADLGADMEMLMLRSIANTFISAYNLDGIIFTVDGSNYESENFLLEDALVFSE